MPNKMLIDATHPEETRVVVLRGNRVEEFDFEAADRQQLRGNIYLAKVTRVEPSLQAAFVDYGGNRHGFLAFSEIHPDYYQIPYADRQALLQEHAREDEEEAAAEAAAEKAAGERAAREEQRAAQEPAGSDNDQRQPAMAENAAADEISEPVEPDTVGGAAPDQPFDDGVDDLEARDEGSADDAGAPALSEPLVDDGEAGDRNAGNMDGETGASENGARNNHGDDNREENGHVESVGHDDGHVETVGGSEDEHVESVGAEDALEEVPQRRKPRPRQYKIQEVIKRRQVLLVQVVKEERGNKGAALTTYLSLAGRYSVLMPNTGRGGGISRKITNPADRKRLKAIATDLDVPEGMGVILRTAGANRTKTEVKRDFEYLLRLWENVRELTLRSTAPKLVYEEGSLIKRSIRDLYSREIEQVVVAGDDAYREAKDFMRMLMPSHARNVQQYRDDAPIFARSGVEAQLDAMFSPQVTLKSGGYIVINQTEALVSIDVNSGRSTREHSIEDTALNTNLEAAEEISRQLRLRDLAGLIVIDFIDMEEKRNNRSVERKLKDCLRADRARIQVGRISHFGLLEMSRQRIRTGVLESSTVHCPHCRGTGQVRSISSLSLQILRALEDNLLRHGSHHLYVRTRPEVALYILNQKRTSLAQLEARFGLSITVLADTPPDGAGFVVERGAPVERREDRPAPIAMSAPRRDPDDDGEAPDVEAEEEIALESDEDRGRGGARDGESGERKSRRQRGSGSGDDRREDARASGVEQIETDGDTDDDSEDDGDADEVDAKGDRSDDTGQDRSRRRRGRRGGRRRSRSRDHDEHSADSREDRRHDHAAPAESEFAPSDTSVEDAALAPQSASDGQMRDDPSSDRAAEGTSDRDSDPPEPTSEGRGDADIPDTSPPQAEPELPIPAAQSQPEEAKAESLVQPEGTGNGPERELDPTADRSDRVPEMAVAEAAIRAEPIDENRPKRSGWWSRRSAV